ncbi:PREDICTED: E3 ubiquitin-protein ligase At3g02290-like [Nelumbo nucifera]|uniref:RING-type E3 ubiquitin transferase n=1 Tax=Nelumbo nucifera TaxID=4432 RepID=A0A1U7ZCM7_NELNU|nr:PREDICTED: E3 ubiquitin-protein ligase At3g02290-like [Nelumbo nucifera]
MGAFCCCPCSEEFEEYAHPSNSIYRHCICVRYFLLQLFSGYSTLFHRLEGRPVASSVQGATSLASSGVGSPLPDSPLTDTYHSVTRPVSYDAEQRYARLQRDGLVSRREKSMSHFQEESQPLRRNSSSSGVEPMGAGKKWDGIESEEECKVGRTESSEKVFSTKGSHGLSYMLPSSEDEDVCPTCLEEYTPENPKIVARCSHHFHLGCIYEWMERSENCPLCGKEMEFCESP